MSTWDRYRRKLDTWHIGRLTGRNRELVDFLRKSVYIYICCEKETNWKVEKAQDIGEEYKIILINNEYKEWCRIDSE